LSFNPETGSCYEAQAGFKLGFLLPQLEPPAWGMLLEAQKIPPSDCEENMGQRLLRFYTCECGCFLLQ
jgi:hypothetical protein